MKTTHLELGNWNVICDRCGFKLKASKLQEEPRTGLMVCSKCWEGWHPQEVIRPVPDQQPLPWTRPESTDRYLTTCTVDGVSAIAGLAVAGCSIVGRSVRGIPICSIGEMSGGADYVTADCARADSAYLI